MLAQERYAIIIDMLRENNVIKISDIVQRFGISNLTARRDLDALQDQNLVHRVYGGAILLNSNSDTGTLPDTTEHTQTPRHLEGRAIGKAAADIISEGDSIFLGTGTTVMEIARNMHHLSNVTVLTNSLAVLNELSTTNNSIYVLGGFLDPNEHSIYGNAAISMLQSFCADKAFIGCGGITFSHGISDYLSQVADINRIMVENALKTILVADSHKFGSNAFAVVCPITSVNTILTDDDLPIKYQEGIRQRGIDLHMIPVGSDSSDDDSDSN